MKHNYYNYFPPLVGSQKSQRKDKRYAAGQQDREMLLSKPGGRIPDYFGEEILFVSRKTLKPSVIGSTKLPWERKILWKNGSFKTVMYLLYKCMNFYCRGKEIIFVCQKTIRLLIICDTFCLYKSMVEEVANIFKAAHVAAFFSWVFQFFIWICRICRSFPFQWN